MIIDRIAHDTEKCLYGRIFRLVAHGNGKEKLKFAKCFPVGNFRVTGCGGQGRFKSQSSHSARFGMD
jgi:hypothetical protein